MKRFYLSVLALLAVIILGFSGHAFAQSLVTTFSYNGGVQTLVVPAGCFSASVDAIGANGGTAGTGSEHGGYGGRVQCVLSVTPGSVLYIYVGQKGVNGSGTYAANARSYNGGGAGFYYGGSGGGGSDIRLTNTSACSANYSPGATLGSSGYRLVVAGGGGGAGDGYGTDEGGNGGGLSAGAGQCTGYSYYAGGAGSQTAGGSGAESDGKTGGFGYGGDSYTYYHAGGGGGGYYGGGGAYYEAGAGGGSSFTDPASVNANGVPIHTQGYNVSAIPGGNGQITVGFICTPPVNGVLHNINICGNGINVPNTYTGSGGGAWFTTNPSVASISNTGVVTSVAVGTAQISYSLVYACGSLSPTAVVTVNPVPLTIYNNPSTICSGATEVLHDNDNNGTWSSSNPFLATIDPVSGTVTGQAGGSVIITYNESTGCTTTATVNVNPSPYAISGSPNVCIGSTTALSDASAGGSWSSGSGAFSITPGGVVTGLSHGAGYVSYTFPSTGCYSTFLLNVNNLPNVYYTGPNTGPRPYTQSYCAGGTGVTITLNQSDVSVDYTLYNGSTPLPPYQLGSTGELYWPNQTGAGQYHIVAVNSFGCSVVMRDTITVAVAPLPKQFVISTPEGLSYCANGNAPDLVLDSMEPNTSYSLYQNGSYLISFQTGDTLSYPSLDWGAYINAQNDSGYSYPGITAGTYYVNAAQSGSLGCSDNMANTPTIVMNELPTPQNVTVSDGGVYCFGGAGVHVGLDNSAPGVNYRLYNDGNPVGSVMPGTNSALNFGTYDTGTYTVFAVNSVTGCSDYMNGNPMVTTNPLPDSLYIVSGGGSRCYGTSGLPIAISTTDFGVNYQLYRNDTAVGIPVVGNSSTDTFGIYYSAGTYKVVATNQTTGCAATMNTSTSIMVNPLPTVEAVTPLSGSGYFCANGSGIVVGMTNTQSGIDYKLQNLGSTLGEITGSGSSMNFLAQTTPGYYTILATNNATGCTNELGGTNIYVNPLPDTETITGGGPYCNGAAGVHVGLNYSVTGINYQLYNNGATVGSAVAGSNTLIDFGVISDTGHYYVKATNVFTGCQDYMAGVSAIAINPLPTAFAVTNGGSYCAGGAGVPVGLSSSNTGISYQLIYNGNPTGLPMNGTGTSLNFGAQSLAGTYTAEAMNTVTGCTSNMTGSKAVSINPLPTSFNVTGGGALCVGAAGVPVGLNSSTAGISYELMDGSTTISTLTGTGGALNFGTYTNAGTYTVHASNPTTLCANGMNGNATVVVNPLPTVYSVTGGGDYCEGGAGVHIGLSGSNTGLIYQLSNGSTVISTITGLTGVAADFGLETMAGTYTVSATNSITGCTASMFGSKTVGVNSLPGQYTMTGGGSFCQGGTGVAVGLNGSVAGISYTLMNGLTTLGTLTGTGGSLNFGNEMAAGAYSVIATNPSTTCTNTMLGGATVVVNPLPEAFAVTGGGSYCSGGTGVTIGLVGSGYGINYQPMVGGVGAGLPIGGTGSTLGRLETLAGTYTVLATNVITGCTNIMDGTATITITPTVLPTVSVSDGSATNTVCLGATGNFSASSTNGGSSPTYQWSVNGVNEGSGSTFSYVPANGDVVTCQVTSDATCASPTAVSSGVTVNVVDWVVPSASISANPGSSVCPETPVTFTGSSVNGGTAPGVAFLVNDNYVSMTGNTYNYVPQNNDVVTYMVVSNAQCHTQDTVYSTPIVMNVNAPFMPMFTISSSLGAVSNITQGVGRSDTLRALVTNAGVATLNYQWYIDGNLIHSATGDRLILDTVFNNDTITCLVTSTSACGDSTGSAGVRIYLENLGVQTMSSTSDVKLIPNPNKGYFTLSGVVNAVDNQDVSIEVTNVIGQVVYTGAAKVVNGTINEKIELSNTLSNGMYILNMRSGTDRSVFNFVIEK